MSKIFKISDYSGEYMVSLNHVIAISPLMEGTLGKHFGLDLSSGKHLSFHKGDNTPNSVFQRQYDNLVDAWQTLHEEE